MNQILCIAAVVVLAVLAAAVLLARSIGQAQQEIDNMRLDRENM